MPSLYSRQDIERSYDAQLLRVVIQLFDEFPSVPMLRVIRALKHARGTLHVNSIDLVSRPQSARPPSRLSATGWRCPPRSPSGPAHPSTSPP
jgi:hypothetical protein